ncbi:MAG: AI-2E family transporter [Bacillota bacterium]|nr:AI-2E family transporter [Bacillota bacterium]
MLLAVRNTAGALLLTLVGVYLARFLFPFLLGAVVAAVLDPVVSAGYRRGLPRGLTAVLLLAALTGGTLAVLGVGLARLSTELGSLVESGWGEEGLRKLEDSWKELEPLLRGEPAQQGLGALAGWAVALVRAVPGAAVAIVISLLSAYLLLRDKEGLLKAATRILPRTLRADGTRAVREVSESLGGIVRALLLLAVTTGAVSVVGLSLFGVRYAWLLGVAAGLLDLAPLVGPSAVFLPTAIYLALSGSPGKALGVLAVAGVGTLVRQILEPRLLAAGTGLHPLAMLLAVYAGYRLFGPFGLVMGPLAAAFFAALFRAAVEPFLEGA